MPPDTVLPVSYSGGLFELRELLLEPLKAMLARRAPTYSFVPARLPPDAGAALYAAKLAGEPIGAGPIAALEAQVRQGIRGG